MSGHVSHRILLLATTPSPTTATANTATATIAHDCHLQLYALFHVMTLPHGSFGLYTRPVPQQPLTVRGGHGGQHAVQYDEKHTLVGDEETVLGDRFRKFIARTVRR